MLFFLENASNLCKYLPNVIKEQLSLLKQGSLKNDILLIKNLPIPVEIKTPPNNLSNIGETTCFARCQALINQYLGEMVSYEAEGNGHLFQDMVPNEALKETQTSLGSSFELELHTEQAFSKLKPDFLCLGCLRGDKQAKTYYLNVKEIFNKLPLDSLVSLGKELWNIGVDLSFIMNGCQGDLRGPLAIFKNEELIFDQDLMIGIDENAEKIKKEIIEIYLQHRNHVILREGEMLIMNNKKLVHGRSDFVPKFDGEDRFIIRSFIHENKSKIKDCLKKGTRIIKKENS